MCGGRYSANATRDSKRSAPWWRSSWMKSVYFVVSYRISFRFPIPHHHRHHYRHYHYHWRGVGRQIHTNEGVGKLISDRPYYSLPPNDESESWSIWEVAFISLIHVCCAFVCDKKEKICRAGRGMGIFVICVIVLVMIRQHNVAVLQRMGIFLSCSSRHRILQKIWTVQNAYTLRSICVRKMITRWTVWRLANLCDLPTVVGIFSSSEIVRLRNHSGMPGWRNAMYNYSSVLHRIDSNITNPCGCPKMGYGSPPSSSIATPSWPKNFLGVGMLQVEQWIAFTEV